MSRRTNILAFVTPLMGASVLAILFSVSGSALTIFAFAGGIFLLPVAVIVAVVLFVSFLAFRKSRPEYAAKLGATAAGLMLSVILALPLVWGAGWLVREIRRPVRAALAERVIDRAAANGWSGHEEIELEGFKRLLSDGGTIEVYSGADGTSVFFWDIRGILGDYTASLYATSSEGAEPPGGVSSVGSFERESEHWWRSLPD
ncbi:MAG: hypothetical protein CVT59_05520 [Actinobacteria bacterium HGW-Actinobacteria-1]|jgi:hypothetical protein|nr:MAG: hypothetical protein CVT59_05520 [Actinobacteria bacterium HGW-Actinobacteria-1]